MLYQLIRLQLSRFSKETSGSATVEFVVTLPLMVLLLGATYEFFEAHRYRSVRDKATYTIADMVSREQGEDADTTVDNAEEFITDTYVDNSLRLFDEITNDNGVNQIRISMVQFIAGDAVDDLGTYVIEWSEVRGTGTMNALTNADLENAHDRLPLRANGQYLLMVESKSAYEPVFEVGFNDELEISTRVFTDLRFAPQLKYYPPDIANTNDPRDDEEDEGDTSDPDPVGGTGGTTGGTGTPGST
ncbi:TadE/TadG family type IV pilus assembly protein [Roseovarius sp. EL26]|uniref:TadE/TadG family type IV pilus assembly protein n=1 Tax=Roseovarius sp. EL26 TaxID=2126672 RepID=UPI000EA3FB26|nr:TadE/TadG family type IV pilus assembly protein [Roseovarius sp. EL26]